MKNKRLTSSVGIVTLSFSLIILFILPSGNVKSNGSFSFIGGTQGTVYPTTMTISFEPIMNVSETNLVTAIITIPREGYLEAKEVSSYQQNNDFYYQGTFSIAGMVISPSQTITTKEIMPTDESVSVKFIWSIRPSTLGTYNGNVSIIGGNDSWSFMSLDKNIEIVVVDDFMNFTAKQIKLLTVLGSFLGSLLTLPGLFAFVEQIKQKLKKETYEAKQKQSGTKKRPT